jgi:CDP-glycerol glycerophosphotransferase (TagB/SpsB family)
MKNYFKYYPPKAVKVWGGGILALGRIYLSIIEDITDPLNFHYNLGAISISMPYFDSRDHCDMYLAKSKLELDYYNDINIPDKKIIQAGQVRYDQFDHLVDDETPESSRSKLDIPSTSEFYIFFAPSKTIRGVTPKLETERLCKVLGQFINDHRDSRLIVKPHPNGESRFIQNILDRYDSDRIHFIDSTELPYQCINAADIVVTKFSSVGVEAKLLDTSIVSVVLDGSENFQEVYNEVGPVFTETEPLYRYLASCHNQTAKQLTEGSDVNMSKSELDYAFRTSGPKVIARAIEKNLN